MPISIVLSLICPLGSALALLPLRKGRQWIYLPGQAQHVIFTRDSESIQHSPFLHLWKRKLRVGRRCGCPILESHPGCPSSLPPHQVTSPCPLLPSLSGEGAVYPEASLAWIASAFLLVCITDWEGRGQRLTSGHCLCGLIYPLLQLDTQSCTPSQQQDPSLRMA